MSDQPPAQHVGEAAEPTGVKHAKKPPKNLDAASPAPSPSAIAAEHRRKMERERATREHQIAAKKLEHEQAEAKLAAAHKRKMDEWMFWVAVGAGLASDGELDREDVLARLAPLLEVRTGTRATAIARQMDLIGSLARLAWDHVAIALAGNAAEGRDQQAALFPSVHGQPPVWLSMLYRQGRTLSIKFRTWPPIYRRTCFPCLSVIDFTP